MDTDSNDLTNKIVDLIINKNGLQRELNDLIIEYTNYYELDDSEEDIRQRIKNLNRQIYLQNAEINELQKRADSPPRPAVLDIDYTACLWPTIEPSDEQKYKRLRRL